MTSHRLVSFLSAIVASSVAASAVALSAVPSMACIFSESNPSTTTLDSVNPPSTTNQVQQSNLSPNLKTAGLFGLGFLAVGGVVSGGLMLKAKRRSIKPDFATVLEVETPEVQMPDAEATNATSEPEVVIPPTPARAAEFWVEPVAETASTR